jgi:hypothetical protein
MVTTQRGRCGSDVGGLERLAFAFDDERAVANAGLVLVSTLVDRLGIEQVIDETLVWGSKIPIRHRNQSFRAVQASTTALLSLYLSVSLARARASGSTARPSRCRGCSHRWCAIPHRGCPQLLRAAASARGRHPSRHGLRCRSL